MAKTNISWCDATWNPIVGCSIKSKGCKNCYAMRAAWRMSHNPKTPQYHGTAKKVNDKPVWTGRMSFAEKAFQKPLKTRKPTRFFVNSMGDLFHEDVPDVWIDRVFAVMALCPQHVFQVLTKRAERMRAYFARDSDGFMPAESRIEHYAKRIARERGQPIPIGKTLLGTMPFPHVHLGVSVEDQATANERIPLLLDTPAAVRWISAEPLLGPVRLDDIQYKSRVMAGLSDLDALFTEVGPEDDPDFQGATLDWVVVGGESGPGARAMHPDWARSLRDQCKAAGVPFHFKQWGAWAPGSDLNYDKNTLCMDRSGRTVKTPARINDFPEKSSSSDGWVWMRKHGKKAAGRLLDGETHDGRVA